MSSVLVIAHAYPQPDEASGDLRFFTLLTLLAKTHEVMFCALSANGGAQPRTHASTMLEEAGIKLGDGDFLHTLKHYSPDIVWFEYYHQARSDFLALIDRYNPRARIVIDSVDVHFKRLETRAKLTGKAEDGAAAREMKLLELSAYARANMVIAVSNDDKQLLKQELPDMAVEVVPNIHTIPPFPDISKRQYAELVFVGGFRHDPNVDAMLYFCHEIMPRIISIYPQTRLKIIGSNAPRTIHALANEHVEVLGYVPVTAPYLERAYISVAPLRYGGGMKGKVGEAMSYGLPVVTTSFGAEGFGLAPGEDLLIGDSAESFAEQVLALLGNRDLHERVARQGYAFIKQHYSVPAVEQLLNSAIHHLEHLPPRTIPLGRKCVLGMKGWYTRNIAWRFKPS